MPDPVWDTTGLELEEHDEATNPVAMARHADAQVPARRPNMKTVFII
jgi:hypothetical protein